MQAPTTMTYDELLRENAALRSQLEDATETLEAIRTGSVDALVVQRDESHELYTLQTADVGYRVFIENMNEGAITLSQEGLILYANAAFTTMAGVQPGSALGAVFSNLLTKDSVPDFTDFLERVWKSDGKAFVVLTNGTRRIPCQLSATQLAIEAGPVLSVIVTDLTAQKDAEAQLKEKAARLQEAVHELESSNHDLQQFASVASHDLQEPLRKISVFGGMLRKSLGGKLEGIDAMALDKIIASSARLKTMVGDVLSFSRLAGKTPDAEPEYTDLNMVVAEVLDDFEVLIKECDAQVSVGTLPVVDVSTGASRQVFQNLISNALKFSRAGVPCVLRIEPMPETSEVQIEEAYRDVNRYALVSVADNGIGFDENFRDRIFDLFQRLNTKDNYEGSGIGLAVAKRLMERAGGSIRVHSREGEGSEFVLVLPVAVKGAGGIIT